MLDVSLSQRCIIAIGNTGNGKSFTATVFGARNVRIGHSSESETDTITIHPIEKGGFYVDTPGLDDSHEEKDDDGTKRSIFLKMLELNIRNITTVLWFVEPDIRAKASYKRQARFIESLAKYDGNRNVWDNTIIVTKGTADSSSQGPRDAAREIAQEERHTKEDLTSNIGEFKIWLFESSSPSNVFVKARFSSDQLNEYGVFKGSEPERILAKYESLMKGHLENPIRINLRKVKCSKCPEETDPRLAFPKCHSEMEYFHPNMERVHQGNFIDIHPSSEFHKHSDTYVEAKEKQVFDDSPQAWTVRVFSFGGVNPTRPKLEFGYWKCCNNRDVNTRGCKRVYRCCERDIQSSGCRKIYEGCRHEHREAPCLEICGCCKKRSDTEGCKRRCSNCKNDPLNEKGCSETKHNFN
ncbi:hypothetical protein Glove_345g57 [Diversispora epigaea]|uniref:G domain-containing protein n=1 Tax=Diversispora epigaea TaxID=1348612 RepID=A0A397HG15_9GLOM|nr:hypothetical protein Glove_345g57 [Diversispora epigaea]